jgi:hypothetical protein
LDLNDVSAVNEHGFRANDSVFAPLRHLSDTVHASIRPSDPHTNRPVEEALPFRVGVVKTEAELLRVQALRRAAYGHHFPAMAASFGLADPVDRLEDVVIFYAEDKVTGRMVGTARIHSNRSGPLQIEHSVALPGERQGQLLAEITRLAVIPGYAPPVRLALVKASHLWCIGMQIGGVVAGSRRSLVRAYENLGFSDLFGDDRMVPLAHAGGLDHRVLFRDTVTSEAVHRARVHPDYRFVFRTFHPDIAIFGASLRSGIGARGRAAAATPQWRRAA